MRTTLFCVLAFAGGCASLSDSSSRVDGEEVDSDECKIEGDQIGADVVLRLGGKTVTFEDWTEKAGDASELVGFTISVTGAADVGYVVKAATEQFPSRSLTWLHPNGTSAHAISNVDFCEECEDGSCDGGDGGGDDGSGGECDGGDGCPEPPSGDGPLL